MCATLVLSPHQWVRKLKKKCPFCLYSHAYMTPCPFCVPQRGEMLIVGFLDTNYLVLIGFWYALCWYFLRFSRWENSKRNVYFTTLTSVHQPMSLSRTSGMRTTNSLFLACEFRVAINEQFDMTTVCKFQYLQKNCLLSSHFVALSYNSCLSVLSA